MSKKQTAVHLDRDNAELNYWPYIVTIAGQVEPKVKASKKLNAANGVKIVSVQVPEVNGRPMLADSTLDAVARRIEPEAKVYARSGLEFGRYQRLYTV